MVRWSSARARAQSSWAIALLVGLLGLTSVGVLAYVVDHRATAAVRAEARASLLSTTSLTARFLGAQLSGVEDLMASYARRPSLSRALAAPGGVGTAELDRQMEELQRARPEIATASVLDSAGTVLAAPQATQFVGFDLSDRDFYTETIGSKQPYVSRAVESVLPGNALVVTVAAPVLDGERVTAILVASFELADVQAFVTQYADEAGIDVTVTDQAGAVVARSGSAPSALDVLSDDRRVRAALAGHSGNTEDAGDASGSGLLSAYSPVDGVGWAVVAAVPESVAFAEVERLKSGVLRISVVLGLLMLLGAAVMSRALRTRDRARGRAERLASITTAVLDASREGITLAGRDGSTILSNSTMSGFDLGASSGPAADVYAEMARAAPTMSDPGEATALATTLESDPEVVRAIDFTQESSGRSFHLYTRPVTDAYGPVGRLFVVRETTAERNAQIAVQEAKEEAELANRAKSEFLSRMSHELRTPLNAILGFTQLLEMGDLPGAAADRVGHISLAGRHLLALINEVLEISRIEAGGLELSVEPVQLLQLLTETQPLVSGLAATGDVALELAIAEDHWAQADRQRLTQVMVNLLTNAIKYNRPGGRVCVTSTRVDGRLHVRVKDTGRGIPDGRLADLFVPFNRLGADSSGVEGTGLGLSLSRALAEAMGGRLTLEATSSGGSTFLLELPSMAPGAADSVTPGSHHHLPEEAEPGEPTGPVAPHTVLYIEDNGANVALVASILRARPNLTLVSCADPTQGLEVARREQPSLILLDLHLPGLSGEEVLVILKADRLTTAIPVVIVTADIVSADPAHLLALGATEFITKPLDVQAFLSVVDALLLGQTARRVS